MDVDLKWVGGWDCGGDKLEGTFDLERQGAVVFNGPGLTEGFLMKCMVSNRLFGKI